MSGRYPALRGAGRAVRICMTCVARANSTNNIIRIRNIIRRRDLLLRTRMRTCLLLRRCHTVAVARARARARSRVHPPSRLLGRMSQARMHMIVEVLRPHVGGVGGVSWLILILMLMVEALPLPVLLTRGWIQILRPMRMMMPVLELECGKATFIKQQYCSPVNLALCSRMLY